MGQQTSERSDQPVGSPKAPGWGFWLWWVLASTVGWSVGGYLGSAAGWGLSRGIAVVGYGAGAAAGGIAAGVLQWLVLRQQVARAGWWVLASTVGWPVSIGVGGIGVQAVRAVTDVTLPAVTAALIPAIYGAITGSVLVWLLRQPVPAAATEE